MSQQKVKLCYIQTPVTIPGVFTSMTTLDVSKFPTMEMHLHDNGGIVLTVKNLSAFIPAANIKIALLEPEIKAKPVPK